MSIKERTKLLPIKSQNKIQCVTSEYAMDIVQEFWYQYAERLLNKVIDVCGLDEDQADALRKRELRPNDFHVVTGYQ